MNSLLNDLIRSSYTGLIALLFTFFAHQSWSQSLSGTLTIGTGGNYTTLTEAVTDVTAKGVNGPVVFRLKTGTFTEKVTIRSVSGASAINTITFESESGNAQDVVLSFAPTSTNNYVIRLDNS